MRHHWKLISASVGGVLVVLSLVLAFAIAPALAKLPTNTDTTRTYSGTASVLLNPTAISGGGGPLVLRNVPITLTHVDTVVRSNSSAAVVRDVRTVTPAGGSTATLTNLYVVDRHNLGASTALTYPGTTTQVGVSFNFPIGTAKHSYTGWVPDTRTTTTLSYSGTATKDGVQTYVFRTTVATAPIREPAQLAGLPTSVPKGSLTTLASQLGLPQNVLAQLGAVLNRLPASLPLNYTYKSDSTFWVEPTTGVIVDQQTSETRGIVLPASVLGSALPVATLSQFTYRYTPESVTAAADDAKSKASTLTLLDTTLPLIVGLLGAALVIAAGVGYLIERRRPPQGPAPATPSTPEPAGSTPGPS